MEYLTQVPVLGVFSAPGLLQTSNNVNLDQLQHHESWKAPKIQEGKGSL